MGPDYGQGDRREGQRREGLRLRRVRKLALSRRCRGGLQDWAPTFTEAVEGSVELVPYTRNGADLTFIRCRRCGRLIGQLADEGSDRHAIRFCVNCGALGFEQK